jgi:hypothetical protein
MPVVCTVGDGTIGLAQRNTKKTREFKPPYSDTTRCLTEVTSTVVKRVPKSMSRLLS